jgi:hypothetical protein
MVLAIKTPDFEIHKGVLAQAKLLEPGKSLKKRDADNLRRQCRNMLA